MPVHSSRGSRFSRGIFEVTAIPWIWLPAFEHGTFTEWFEEIIKSNYQLFLWLMNIEFYYVFGYFDCPIKWDWWKGKFWWDRIALINIWIIVMLTSQSVVNRTHSIYFMIYYSTSGRWKPVNDIFFLFHALIKIYIWNIKIHIDIT